MDKKNNKNLLSEEVNKFKALLEYGFYEDRAGEDPNKAEKLMLGNEMSEEEEELGNDDEVSDDEISIPGEEGSEEGGDEDPFADDSGDEEPSVDGEDDFGGDDAGEDLEMAPEEEPIEDDAIELDVTELVKGSEEAKASADSANLKIDQLMGMVDSLEGQLAGMSKISHKIDSLENELEKRAPTPDEKLEMRSLDSAPFNMRLGDFWSDQEGQYDVMNTKDQEYVLDKKEINSDYSDSKIKDSLDVDNEYEEEDI